jgi:hypothetical protein
MKVGKEAHVSIIFDHKEKGQSVERLALKMPALAVNQLESRAGSGRSELEVQFDLTLEIGLGQ